MKRRLSLIVIFLIIFCNVYATDYYVDATVGSNTTGNGTSAHPWKTITYALSKINGSGDIPDLYQERSLAYRRRRFSHNN
jgi:hypothetical protein